jgi:hypothetical protein
VQFQAPVANIIEEKSGRAIGTGVYDGDGCAWETAGAKASPIANAATANAMDAACFITIIDLSVEA